MVFGFLLTAGLPLAAWFLLAPATTVQTRFVADTPGQAGRAALAEAALRLVAAPAVSTTLDGDSLAVTITDGTAETARARARSLSAIVMDMSLPSGSGTAAEPANPLPRGAGPAVTLQVAAATQTARLTALLEAADGRLAALSAALTGIARDLAAAARATPDRRAGRETLDKAAVALADLQLQRIQLLSRYQDDFPAVATLDAQIRSVRAFIGDETRRAEAASRPAADPGDPILSAERDRVLAEQSQWLARRTAIAAELAAASRVAASTKEERPAALPAPTYVTAPAPMLVEASIMAATSPDPRWWAVPVAAATGLLAWLVSWFASPRRSRDVRAELALRRLEDLLLAQNPVLPGQPAENIVLSRTAALRLDPPSGMVNFRQQRADTAAHRLPRSAD